MIFLGYMIPRRCMMMPDKSSWFSRANPYPFNPGSRIYTFYTENVPQKLKLGIHIYDTWYQSFT
jgi:hypothetical protein